MIAWDKGRIVACTVASVSLVVHFFMSSNIEAVVSHAFFLLLPLSVIFWPEYCDRVFRLSSEGRAHSMAEATPGVMLQLVGWILLIVICSIPLLGPAML